MGTALAVADYMLSKKISVTPLQIIKLVYIAHGWYLGLSGNPLIHERIEAWKFGPVIPSLYHEFKKYGDMVITNLAYCNTSLNDDAKINDRTELFDEIFTPDEKSVIDQVVEQYVDFTGNQLINLTHGENTPWFKCYKKDVKFTEIPNDIIKTHYEGLINNAKSQ